MRTTISIPNELRARILSYAAKQGKHGYSEIVCEAVEEYLSKEEDKSKLLEKVMQLEGSLTEEEATVAKKRIKEFWDRWNS